MRDLKKVSDVIRRTISAELAPLKVIYLDVSEFVGAEGDDYLNVEVAYDGDFPELDIDNVASMIRVLRPKLYEIGEKSFPLISYSSKADFEVDRSAAA